MKLAAVGLAITLAATAHAQAPAKRTVLVELFTSEGCSSCPPADAVLQKMNGNRTPGGALVVTLSEHVTYWNHDGWTDPFSDDTFTQRQADYEQHFKVPEPYTPQVVVNGAAQVLGSDGYNIVKAIDALPAPSTALHISSATVDGKKITVTFAASGAVPAKGADIYAVVTDDTATSKVLKGENAGRTISHVSVARSFAKVAKFKPSGEQTIMLTLPTPAPNVNSSGHHIVLFAQEPGQGKVLAVESHQL